MKMAEAILVLVALGQETRLETFRLVARAGDVGVSASIIADTLGVPRNTMSSHLAKLTQAGILQAERVKRNIIFRANPSTVDRLADFLNASAH